MKAIPIREHSASAREISDRFFADRERVRGQAANSGAPGLRPATAAQRSSNELRPQKLEHIVGQAPAKQVMEFAMGAGAPIDHVLLVGPAGTGKTTFAHVVANELDVDVYEVEAPVSHETLMSLRTTMRDGDILKVEEIHQQGIMERRGKSGSTQPEVLYAVMEDRVIATATGVLPFPRITVIGTTTDEGMLPDAFVARFPLKPILEPYGVDELIDIARRNAEALGTIIDTEGAETFALASRGVPRQINNFVKNAAMFPVEVIDAATAKRVLDMNYVTRDGLTRDMQAMLLFLYEKAGRRKADGEVVHQASVNTIATAIGKSRDSKAVAMRVEPYLIEQGFVQVTHGGRLLTDSGKARAVKLR